MALGPTGIDGQPPSPELERLARRLYRQAIPLTFLANCVIAGFLTVLTHSTLASNLLYAHAIGFSILGMELLGHRLFLATRIPHGLVSVVALALGSALGLVISWLVETGSIRGHLESLPFAGASVLVIGGAASYFFWARSRIAIHEAQLKANELERAEAARRLAEAELKLLQAQIEPHFLYNTLSNVLSLIDGDPARAKRMLFNLASYLRGSLRRTRAGAVTLGEELDLVRAYLEIQGVRMGARLTFTIACPDALRDATLPPLLVQPLVENALKHGLEPRPRGGAVAVSAAREGGELVVEVRDDGLGLDPRQPPGVGLTNVRRRIEAISGGRGALTLRPLAEGGLCARIALPWPEAGPPATASPAAAAPAAPAAAPGAGAGDRPLPLGRKVSP